jgi:hypothetical protein
MTLDSASDTADSRPTMRTAVDPVEINTFANVAPSTPVGEIVRWADIKPDRLFKMVHAGRVYWNASRMHQVFPDWFSSPRAAIDARGRMGNVRERVRALVSRRYRVRDRSFSAPQDAYDLHRH